MVDRGGMETYDRKIFRELITLESALRKILVVKPPERKTTKKMEEALGYISAENVFASIDSPPFTRSEMDGYAVRSTDILGADEMSPILLRIVARTKAGEIFHGRISRGEAVDVATGSPLPLGADAVVSVENTAEKNGEVEIFRSVGSFYNVLEAGRDFKAGDLLVGEGQKLHSIHISALAATGRGDIIVFDKPVVGVLATGKEVVRPGAELQPGEIFDVNSYSIASQASSLGGNVRLYDILPDELGCMLEVTKTALRETDLIVISGGSSSGPGDIAYKVFEELDSKVDFHGVLIRPGKPTAFGVVEEKPIFILPGNPFSAYVAFDQLVKPLMESWMGVQVYGKVDAKLMKRYFSARGRREFLPVALVKGEELLAYPLGGSSGAISRLLRADGMIQIPSDEEFLMEGHTVEVNLLPYSYPSDLVVYGYIDPILQIATWETQRRHGCSIKLIAEDSKAFREPGEPSTLVALATFREDVDEMNGRRMLFRYSKVFGLSFRDELMVIKERPDEMYSREMRLAYRSPLSIEGKMQERHKSKMNVFLVGYAATDGEALALLKNGSADAAFTYENPGPMFLPLERLDVTLYGGKDRLSRVAENLLEMLNSRSFMERCSSLYPWLKSQDKGD